MIWIWMSWWVFTHSNTNHKTKTMENQKVPVKVSCVKDHSCRKDRNPAQNWPALSSRMPPQLSAANQIGFATCEPTFGPWLPPCPQCCRDRKAKRLWLLSPSWKRWTPWKSRSPDHCRCLKHHPEVGKGMTHQSGLDSHWLFWRWIRSQGRSCKAGNRCGWRSSRWVGLLPVLSLAALSRCHAQLPWGTWSYWCWRMCNECWRAFHAQQWSDPSPAPSQCLVHKVLSSPA